MSIEEQRKAFEEAVNNPIMTITSCNNDGGYYQDAMANFGFKMWLASVQREGYVLVGKNELIAICADTQDIDTYHALQAMIEEAQK